MKRFQKINDFGWVPIIAALWLYAAFGPEIVRLYESWKYPRPWITATVSIENRGDEHPTIMYDPDASVFLDSSIWSAYLTDERGKRTSPVRTGVAHYEIDIFDDPTPWSWVSFFDNGRDLPPITVPSVPFSVCVEYWSKSIRGNIDITGPYCSELYDPNRQEN